MKNNNKSHLFKILGLVAFVAIAVGSGSTPLKTTPGQSFKEVNSQAMDGSNGGLVLIARHPELHEIEIYETRSAREDRLRKQRICREGGNPYDYCMDKLKDFMSDSNQGKKYYFRNGIAISYDNFLELLTAERLRQQQQAEYRLNAENKAKAETRRRAQILKEQQKTQMDQEAELLRLQIEQERIKKSRPVLNTE